MNRVVSRDGTEIGYYTSGTGPPLLLVHGGLGDHTRWDALLPYLEPHFTVHAMDRRGRGASGDAPDYDGAREFEDVAQVVNAIAEASGSTVDVYGHSSGGFYAFGAASLTSNIRSLVLYEGWPPVNPDVWLPPPGFMERMEALLAEGKREEMVELVARELAKLTEEELEVYRAQPSWQARVAAAHTGPREERHFLETTFDPEQAAAITVPTLVVVGSESPESWKAEAEQVAAALPEGRVLVLNGQGHGADVVAPEWFAERLLAFLREQR